MSNLSDLFQKYEAVVFFDTETTGLDAKTSQIIELAAIRITKEADGTLKMTDSTDMFIKLSEGQCLPEKIVELTGITDEKLAAEGIPAGNAAAAFANMIFSTPKTLLVAHNAQFDLLFIRELLGQFSEESEDMLAPCDYLDSLTVYKDRRAYPHKLANAITAYGLEEKVQNSHRAIDDVLALYEVCKAMDAERPDLLSYVNLFGYNPKYGVTGDRLPRVSYWPQRFNDYMQSPRYTLPALVRR
ncbi:MAG: 3'-5' exonuclease [Lachnospiraceae bacterium]|nr:3'-5' exonuclease [Lachnospiraceae bacterium]